MTRQPEDWQPSTQTGPQTAKEEVSPLHTMCRHIAKAPVHAYRWTLKPIVGWECRHLPSCSEYALEAIDRNGAWRGSWLAVSRLCRCHPWGTSGLDLVPDIRHVRHPLAPWRYGRWRRVERQPISPST